MKNDKKKIYDYKNIKIEIYDEVAEDLKEKHNIDVLEEVKQIVDND